MRFAAASSKCEGAFLIAGGLLARGRPCPASGSSLLAEPSERTLPISGAVASRAVRFGRPYRFSTVLKIEVWSNGVVVALPMPFSHPGARYTVPALIHGDTSTVGTRTPNRLKSNPCSPTELSGATALAGGGT